MSEINLLTVKLDKNKSIKIFIMAPAETLGGRIGESAGLRRLAVLKRDGTPVRPDGVVVFLKARLGRHRIRIHDPYGVIRVETPGLVFDPPSSA